MGLFRNLKQSLILNFSTHKSVFNFHNKLKYVYQKKYVIFMGLMNLLRKRVEILDPNPAQSRPEPKSGT